MWLVLCTTKTRENHVSFYSHVFLNDLHNFLNRTSWYTNVDHRPQIFATKKKSNHLENGASLRWVRVQSRGNCIIVAKMRVTGKVFYQNSSILLSAEFYKFIKNVVHRYIMQKYQGNCIDCRFNSYKKWKETLRSRSSSRIINRNVKKRKL